VFEIVITKLRREIEPRWVSEYVAKHYPNFPARYRVPLGPIPAEITKVYGEEKGIKIARPWRPEVDALVLAQKKIILIEAKIFKVMDGLASCQSTKI